MVYLEVTFDIDANGILNVSAEDKSTGKSQKITITNDKGRLSKDEIEKMVQEAERFQKDDEEQYEKVQAKNTLENSIYGARNTINETTDVSEVEKQEVEKLVEEGAKWLEEHVDSEKDVYEKYHKEFSDKIQPVMSKLYSQSQPAQQENSGPTVEEVD